MAQKIAGMVLLTLCFAALCLVVPLCWWGRDGMGPDMMETNGLAAVPGFLILLCVAVVCLSPVWGIALLLIKAGSEPDAKAATVQPPSVPPAGIWPPPPQTPHRKENISGDGAI